MGVIGVKLWAKFARLVSVVVVLFGFVTAACAAPQDTILLADQIEYLQDEKLLVATGNVQVIFGDMRLTAASITYDAAHDKVTAQGPIILTQGDGTRIFADMAELSADLSDGILQGARILLESRFQFAASEIIRDHGRFTTMYKTVGSSCQVCFDRPVPIWQIRSSRVIHDNVEKTLNFHDARLEVFGLPVLYLPNLRTPDPSVRRATGLLVPKFLSAELFGTGVKLPYYIAINDHSDATITPFVTNTGAAILEGEYRAFMGSGSIYLNGVVAFSDGLLTDGLRGFAVAKGQFGLRNGATAQFDLIATSDDSFMRQFNYSESDRLISTLGISRYSHTDYFELNSVAFQSLRDDEDNQTIPLVLPEFEYRRHIAPGFVSGSLNIGMNAVGLTRLDGRDVYRLGFDADWRRNWIFPSGILLESFAQADVNLYRVLHDTAFAKPGILGQFAPSVGLTMRWPLAKLDGGALHVLEPIAQIVYTADVQGNDQFPNEDSQQVEFDETNLFAINRFPGKDRVESGLRANLGLTYNRYDNDGWNVGLTLGQVISLNNDANFSAGSGLGTHYSDVLAAVTLELPPNFRMINRVLFDTALNFKRAESQIWLDYEKYSLEASYLHLDADANAGAPKPRDEFVFGGKWRFRPNWEISGDARYNLAEATPIKSDGTLTFGNECIRVDLSVSRSFTTSANVPPATSFGLSINLAGFGGQADDEWPAAACGT